MDLVITYGPSVIAGVVATCSWLATRLPPADPPGTKYDKFRKIVNLIGQNYNHASNAN